MSVTIRRGIKHYEMKMRCCYLILESQVDQQLSSSLTDILVAGTEVERGVMMPHCYLTANILSRQ